MFLVFYEECVLEKGTMQRTPQFADFSLLSKEPSEMQRMLACVVSIKIAIEWGKALSETRLFLENTTLEFNEIWQESTLGNKQLEDWKKFEL